MTIAQAFDRGYNDAKAGRAASSTMIFESNSDIHKGYVDGFIHAILEMYAKNRQKPKMQKQVKLKKD